MDKFSGLIFVALLVVSAQSTPFKKCDEGTAPNMLLVYGCSVTPCKFESNTIVTAEASFTAPENVYKLEPWAIVKIHKIYNFLPVEFQKNVTLTQTDLCQNVFPEKCPLYKGQSSSIIFSMVVPKTPLIWGIDADFDFRVLNANSTKILGCLSIPVIVD